MNSPITKLYALMLVLFAALVGFTSYWAVSTRTRSRTRRPTAVR